MPLPFFLTPFFASIPALAAAISWFSSVFTNANILRTCLSVTNPPPSKNRNTPGQIVVAGREFCLSSLGCSNCRPSLLIIADGGGSNGTRSGLWKRGIQRLANSTALGITVCHFPPGTSQWNKIEHRMFSFITQNWRRRPLVSYETIVNLIGSTKIRTGLRVNAKLSHKKYPTGIKVSDSELAKVHLKPAKFHGEWNYSVLPSHD
jgi:hypothetical protein